MLEEKPIDDGSNWCMPTVNRGLTTQLFQNFGSTGKSVTRFSDRDVENELLDFKLLHGVDGLVSGFSHFE